jgi:unsaturated rhamnogalacturonyl hydrolase
MKKSLFFFLFFFSCSVFAISNSLEKDSLKFSERMAISIMKRNPIVWQIDDNKKPKWDYKPSFVLTAFEKLYKKTKNRNYSIYIKDYIDTFIDSTGSIGHYDSNEFNLDGLNPGKLLFDIYQDTNDKRYLSALQMLRKQLDKQPRTPSGGFWHKNIYPNQMWMDGVYMALPFYTQYAVTFDDSNSLDDVATQFEIVHDHILDTKSNLPYHAWDESKVIAWANPETGNSPTIWSRGIGFYSMALVDVLDYFPKSHPKYKELLGYLSEVATAIMQQQDKSGLWFQITDKQKLSGNYLEASGSAMFAYTFAKAANKGYLPIKYKKIANTTFDALLNNFVNEGENGEIHLGQISQGIGLGGTPYRDGSNNYYLAAKINSDNSMGVGAFILAALELNR